MLYSAADVETYLAESEAQAKTEAAAGQAFMRVGPVGVTVPGVLASIVERMTAPPIESKPWLTLDEAAAYSGLPAKFLLHRARNSFPGELAIDVGMGSRHRWMFNRERLRDLK